MAPRQAAKRRELLKKYRENPIKSSYVSSRDTFKVKVFRASELRRSHKLIMAPGPVQQLNLIQRFFKRVRDVLYDPNSEKMVAFRIRLEYNLSRRQVEEHYEL